MAVKSFAMASVICAMLISGWTVEGSLELQPLIVFAAAAVAGAWLGARMHSIVKFV